MSPRPRSNLACNTTKFEWSLANAPRRPRRTQRHLSQVHDENRDVLRPHRYAAHGKSVSEENLRKNLIPGHENAVFARHMKHISKGRTPVLGRTQTETSGGMAARRNGDKR